MDPPPLEVALVHFTASPVVGGVERVLAAHARGLASAGSRVRLIAGRGSASGNGVEHIRLPLADSRHPVIVRQRRTLACGEIPADFGATVDALAKDLTTALTGVDVTIVHNVASMPVNLALTMALRRIARRTHGRGMVVWLHDIGATMSRYADLARPGPPWRAVATAWPGVRYVAVSETRAREFAALARIPETDIEVIPNGVDAVASLGVGPIAGRLTTTLGLERADPLLLTPARITPRKNLGLAIRILAALQVRGLPARLVVTGTLDPHDPDAMAHRRTLHGLARDLGVDHAFHVVAEVLGHVPSTRVVSDLYRIADALLLTSRDEGFGLPILEAGVHRLPIFVSDLPAVHEIAGSDVTYLDPDGDPADLAGIIAIGLQADRAHRLAARVHGLYAWDRVIADRLVPLVREVAGEAG